MPRRPSQLSAVGYQLVLAASAIGRTFALQAVFGLALHRVPLAVVAFMLLAGSSLAFGLMQRLWTVPQLRSLLQLLRIGANGAALVASLWLSLYGLRHLGTFLTVIAEMSEMLVAAAPSVLAADVGVSRQQTNGLLLMSLGYAALLVPVRGDAGSQSRGLALAAHFAAAALTFARERTPHRLAGSVGGPKRLNALVHACALALCAPVALWAALSERREGGEVEGVAAAAHGGQASPASGGWVSASAEAAALALVLLVLPFYARALAQAQLPGGNPARVVAPSAACAALTIDLMLGPRISLASPLVSTGALLVLGGVVLLRTQPAGAELAGLLGGASAARGSGGIPLLARAARAARAGCVQADALRAQVWARKSTRKLLLFLVVQAAFTLVEAALGRASSSLSLVSDACHMLLDCSGLALGLFGEVSARWQPSPAFTYGHSRQEVLCTFANASLLLLTAATLTRQAVSRLLWGGALIETERLLPVAVIGLCVNLLGVCLFSEHHRHLSAQPCAGCDADGAQGTSANMAAVLVHIAADALGSLGVIVSSLLIRYLGWTLAVRAPPSAPRAPRTPRPAGRAEPRARRAARSGAADASHCALFRPCRRARAAPRLLWHCVCVSCAAHPRTPSALSSSPRSSLSARGRCSRSRRRCCCSARPTCSTAAGARPASRSCRRSTAWRCARLARSAAGSRLLKVGGAPLPVNRHAKLKNEPDILLLPSSLLQTHTLAHARARLLPGAPVPLAGDHRACLLDAHVALQRGHAPHPAQSGRECEAGAAKGAAVGQGVRHRLCHRRGRGGGARAGAAARSWCPREGRPGGRAAHSERDDRRSLALGKRLLGAERAARKRRCQWCSPERMCRRWSHAGG